MTVLRKAITKRQLEKVQTKQLLALKTSVAFQVVMLKKSPSLFRVTVTNMTYYHLKSCVYHYQACPCPRWSCRLYSHSNATECVWVLLRPPNSKKTGICIRFNVETYHFDFLLLASYVRFFALF